MNLTRKAHRHLRTAVLVAVTLVLAAVPVTAQDFFYHDNFDDEDVTPATSGGEWRLADAVPVGASFDATSGDLVIGTRNGFALAPLFSVDGSPVASSTEWSFRARMTVHNGEFARVGTRQLNHAALVPSGGGRLEVGTARSITTTPLPYPYVDQELFLQMDAFSGLMIASVWKAGDPSSLVQVSRTYSPVSTIPALGVGDPTGTVTFHEVWVSSSPLGVIPEPSSLALAACAIAVVAGKWRRYRARHPVPPPRLDSREG